MNLYQDSVISSQYFLELVGFPACKVCLLRASTVCISNLLTPPRIYLATHVGEANGELREKVGHEEIKH